MIGRISLLQVLICRPNAAKVLEHPYFWDDQRRTDFISEFSARLNLDPRNPPSPLVQRVESAALEICGKDWTSQIDVGLMRDSRINRSYDGTKINDLIRLIRNKVFSPRKCRSNPFRKVTITSYQRWCERS